MALMPKRVKHRKSQRGRIRGNATRGNRVVFGDFGLQATQGGLAQCADDRSRPHRGPAVPAHRRAAVRPRVSAQVDHLDSVGNPHGQGQRASRSFGRRSIKPGTVLYEISGVSEEAARMCFARLAHKMPVRVRFLRRRAG